MQQDQEGFLYPFVEISKCIDCKLCDSACPIENKIESKMFDRKAYVLRVFHYAHLHAAHGTGEADRCRSR